MPIISKTKSGKTKREWSNAETNDFGPSAEGTFVGITSGSLLGYITTSLGYSTGQGIANAIALSYTMSRYYYPHICQ